MSIKLNVIDREGKKSTIEVEEGTNIKDAIRPAVVPPITRTNAKTTIAVNEPIIIGNSTAKS